MRGGWVAPSRTAPGSGDTSGLRYLRQRRGRRQQPRCELLRYCESERCDENEGSEKTTTEEADDREERHVHINLSEIQMPAWENVVYDRAEWAAMLGRIDIQAQ